ncbi:hypothetical protein LSAT2_017192 [Lamellibrachia satsuma]|nr:hypothetical protein LSAT2_017192 [Lamellibrachia satsuma]
MTADLLTGCLLGRRRHQEHHILVLLSSSKDKDHLRLRMTMPPQRVRDDLLRAVTTCTWPRTPAHPHVTRTRTRTPARPHVTCATPELLIQSLSVSHSKRLHQTGEYVPLGVRQPRLCLTNNVNVCWILCSHNTTT